jgi:hypothetical protein
MKHEGGEETVVAKAVGAGLTASDPTVVAVGVDVASVASLEEGVTLGKNRVGMLR